ncbi:arp2/3 complex [Jaminaea rosea]|uniref:Actin-related protein 2/3 complex subunit 5 n=1 Tax=Jaminaea rosea TaxID=1569628 RepID=A0A316UP80_9BASI|nr:arp2/3 complex [Jaminaea rosea]PWN26151.1 arp2/3 complex [Jaminaea rosea]
MASDGFRSINVDIWEEDVLQESDLVEAYHLDGAEAQQEAEGISQQVRGHLNKGDAPTALSSLLSSPLPYGPSPTLQPAKESILSTLLVLLNSVKSTEISALLKSLDLDQRDTLMKWIYKGLARPELGAGGVLLGWHEKLTEIAGTGCIVRVMTDRRRV